MQKGSSSLYYHRRSPGHQSKRSEKITIRTWKMRLLSQHQKEDDHGKSKRARRPLQARCQKRRKAWSFQLGDLRGGLQRLHIQNLNLNRQTRSAPHEPATAQSTNLRQRNRRKQNDHQKPNSKRKCLSQMDIIRPRNLQRVRRWHCRWPIPR
jgi:hypothetical protein